VGWHKYLGENRDRRKAVFMRMERRFAQSQSGVRNEQSRSFTSYKPENTA